MLTKLLMGAITLLGIIRYILFKRNRKRLEKLVNQFPGPRAYPIIGNIPMFIGSSIDVLRRGKKVFKYDSPARIWLLHKPIIVIFDPDNFQTVANKSIQKADSYLFFKEFLGQGLITANGDKWKKNRRLLNPAFNPRLLHEYFLNVFHEENSKLLNTIDTYVEKQTKFDLWPPVIRNSLNSITLTSMNYRDELENDMFEYGESILKASLLVSKRVYKPWLHPQLIYDLYKQVKCYDKVFDHIHQLPKTIIETKKKEFENQHNNNVKLNEINNTGKEAKTFIDIMLKCPETKIHFSNDQLADEIVNIIMAGSETTAITQCFTLLMLAINQHYQDKVYEEIQNVLGDHEGNVEMNHLNKLLYLEQCIKESLRLFSVIPFSLRNVTEDVQLKDGRIIPAGVTVCLAMIMLHVNPNVYSNPYKWNPDNFSAEAIKNRHRYSFFPFSSGPRSCIGAQYAMLSMKVMLVTLLRRYKFHTDMSKKELRISFDLMTRNLKGYYVRAEKRC